MDSTFRWKYATEHKVQLPDEFISDERISSRYVKKVK